MSVTGHLPQTNIPRQTGRITLLALKAIWAYRLRSTFVALAIALGIASLTIIVASIDGAERKTKEIMQFFGPDALFILGGDIRNRPVGQRTHTLTFTDVERLRQSLPGAYLVVPMRGKSNITARFQDRNLQLPFIVGATAGYGEAWNWPLSEGRDMTEEEVSRGAKVGLIADLAAKELFGNESPLGRTILLEQLPIQIVGKLSYRGTSGGRGGIDKRVIIPITTLTQRFNLDRKYFRALRVKFKNPENMDFHVENLRSLLRELHGLEPEDDDDFSIISPEEALKFMSVFKGGILLFLGITAAVAMVVGGFVLANLFYLSIDQRKTEIGLKKALGAPEWAILLQILFEAILLTLAGALVGMLIGMAAGQLLQRLELMELLYSWKVFAYSVLSAVAIGLIFGLKPARQAAKMDPIHVLKGS